MANYINFDNNTILDNVAYNFKNAVTATAYPSVSKDCLMIDIKFGNNDQRISFIDRYGDSIKALAVWGGFSLNEDSQIHRFTDSHIRIEVLPVYVNAIFQMIHNLS